ncbi:MAG: aspartate-semialdehyde dehydrogenase [Pseudomonadota bacterium]
MIKVGFVGWRGMVGSLLLQRMQACKGFAQIDPSFFSTSQPGKTGPDLGAGAKLLLDAYEIDELANMDVVLACHGSYYTREVYSRLRESGWQGYWLDAASQLRMDAASVIVLDPINKQHMVKSLAAGVKTFIGANCTISLMLLAIQGLLRDGLIEWINTSTYQAISGAGANALQELLNQYRQFGLLIDEKINTSEAVVDQERELHTLIQAEDFPKKNIGQLLCSNVLPWIDRPFPDGATKEEWKCHVETNKLLNFSQPIPVASLCVRVPSLRCHAQSITLKLTQALSLEEVYQQLAQGNEWIKIIPNDFPHTSQELIPSAVAGTLNIHVGRIKPANLEANCFSLFTVADQLLWGAAEPLRRALEIIIAQGQFAN